MSTFLCNYFLYKKTIKNLQNTSNIQKSHHKTHNIIKNVEFHQNFIFFIFSPVNIHYQENIYKKRRNPKKKIRFRKTENIPPSKKKKKKKVFVNYQ